MRLFLILLVALSLRLTWAFVQPANDSDINVLPDQREYLSLGHNLIQSHSLQFDDPRFHQTIYAYRLPGYPVFVAACGGSIRVIRVVQSFVDTLTVLAVFLIARKVSGGCRVAEIAAAITAVNPFLIYFSGSILSETLFTAAVTWAIVAIVFDSRFFVLISAIGMVLRPTAVLIFPLMLIARPRAAPARHSRAVSTVTLMAFFLLLWGFRNNARLGHWIFTTTNDGVTLYDGFNPGATGASDQRFFDQMPAVRSMSEDDRSRYLGRRAMDWAIQHPWRVVLLSGKKILRGWSPVPLSQDFGRFAYRLTAASYAVPFDLAVLAGLWFGRLKRSQKWLLVLPAIGVTLAQVLSVGSIRYRIPAEPALAVVAAVGMASVAKRSTQAGV